MKLKLMEVCISSLAELHFFLHNTIVHIMASKHS